MLYAFAELKGDAVKVIYLVSGTKDGIHQICLVPKERLEGRNLSSVQIIGTETKKSFEELNCVHVYSVQESYPPDTKELWTQELQQYESFVKQGKSEQYFSNR